MEEQRPNTATSGYSGNNPQGQVINADTQVPVSGYGLPQNTYPVEDLEVHQEGSLNAAPAPYVNAKSGLLFFSKRRAMVVSIAIALVVTLLTGASILLLARRAPKEENNKTTTQQDIALKDAAITSLPTELEGETRSLLVNGDIVTRSTLKISNNTHLSVISTQDLTEDRSLILPNSSGTLCLDTNNCNFAAQDALNQTNATLVTLQNRLGQIVVPAVPASSLVNNQQGAVSIQGTANQVTVTNGTGTITLSTPQDLATISSPTFAGLVLNGNLSLIGTVTLPLDCSSLLNGGTLTTNASGQIICGSDDGGSGSGTVSSSGGTAGRIALFTAAQNIEDSLLSQALGTITVAGSLDIGANNLITSAATLSPAELSVLDGGITEGEVTGSITDVTAGSGLTGGAASGNATLNVVSGNGGIVVNANDITLTVEANKGLEVDVNGLSFVDCALNQILKYNGSNQWACAADAAGSGAPDTDPFVTVGNSGNLSSERAITVGTNLSSTDGGANSTFTINTIANPTFATSVTTPLLQSSGALSITPVGALTVGATSQTTLLQGSTTTITSNGAGNDIVLTSADQVRLTGFNCTGFSNGGVLTTDASGNISCTNDDGEPASGITGTGTANRITFFTGAQAVGDSWLLQNGSTLELDNTRNLSLLGGNLDVTGTGTFSSTLTANGNFTVQTGDTFTFNGDAFTDLTGTGLQISSGSLQTTLGTSVDLASAEVTGILPVANGGTSINGSSAANGTLLIGNGTGYTLATLTQGAGITITNGSGSITVANAFGTEVDLTTETAGNYVATITAGNGISGSSSTEGGTPTIALGALTANWNQTGAFDIVLDNSSAELQIREASGAFYGVFDVDDLSVGNATYLLPDTAGNSDEVCLVTLGNCAGSGTGITGSGTQNRVSKFGAGGDNIGDSTITDDGTNVTTSVDLVIQGGALTVGTTSQAASMVLHDGDGETITLTLPDVGSNYSLVFPDAVGDTNQCLKDSDGNGTLFWDDCDGGAGGGSGVLSIDGQSGTVLVANATGAGGTITIDDATTAAKGIASFNSSFFTVSSGAVSIANDSIGDTQLAFNTGQHLTSASTPSFAGLTLTGNLQMNANTIQGTTAIIDFTNFDVASNGNVTAGTYNSQDIDATTNFTGTVTVAGLTTLNGGLTVEAGDTFTFNSDAFTDLTGDGLQVTSNALTIRLDTTAADGSTTSSVSGLEIASGELSLIRGCADGEILKWDNANFEWDCAADAGGAGVGDDVLVGGSNATGANFIDTTASASVAGVDISLNTTPNPDEISITLGDASATLAGIITANAQTFGGAKTFNGQIVAGAGIDLAAQTLAGTTAVIDFNNFDVSSAGAVTAVGVNAGSGLLQGTGGITVSGTVTLSSLTNGFLEVNGSGVVSVGTIDLTTDTAGNYVATITPGNGIAGSSATEGGTPTIALSNLTADWLQSGAFDITLDSSSSELKIRESSGAFYAILDVSDLSADQTFTLSEGGTVVTSGNVATHATTGVTAGSGLTGGGTVGVLTLDIASANGGIVANANDIALTLQANKGLEVDANGLSFIDCGDGQVLKYETTGNTWSCAADGTGGNINGSGTSGRIARFTPNGTTIGDSSLTDDGTDAIATGAFSVNGNTTLGNTSGDTLTVQGTPVSIPNNLNFDTDTLFIDAANNRVGIGTASPGDKLYILNTADSATRVRVENASTGTSASVALVALSDLGNVQLQNFGSGNTSTTAGITLGGYARLRTDGALNGLIFETVGTDPFIFVNNGTERIRIDGSGNIGIGDTSPAALLTVGASDAFQVDSSGNVVTNGTLQVVGLTTLNGGLTVQTGDTFTFNGDAFTDLTGGGLEVSSNALQVRLDTTAADGSTTSSVSGLEIASGELTLIRGCGDGQILKWDNTNFEWDCAADAGGSGVGDDVAVNGTDATGANLLNTAASATVTATTWTLTTQAGNDDITLALGAASGTDAGIVTANTQTFGGDKTFSGLVTANGGLTVETGDTFTVNGDGFTDLTGSGLVVSGNALTVDATSATGFFRNGGNSFSGTATLGTNDANNLVLETNNAIRVTFDQSNVAYFGNGITHATPTGFTLQATGGSGSNIAGASFTIAGGQGTGTGVGGNIVFQYSPAGSTGSSLNALQTACIISGTNGSLSCPGAGSSSERFGSGATAAGTDGVAIGESAAATGNQSIAIGQSSLAGASSTAVGEDSSANASGAIALGRNSVADQNTSIAIGNSATIGAATSIAIGNGATTTAVNQLVVGSTTLAIANAYFGNGVTAASPQAFTLQATGGSGSNIAGASFTIAGGQGTGTGVGGNIVFQYSPAGSTGSSLNALQTACIISGTNGSLSCPGAGADSERFGNGAVAAGQFGVAVGSIASASAADSVAIGRNASASNTDAIAIGRGTTASNVDAISIGGSANAAGPGSIAIGGSSTASNSGSIAIGNGATTTAANQLVVGSTNFGIANAYFGNGVTAATPTNFTLQATSGSGSNIAGASFTLAGGQGTGTGVGGNIVFQYAPAGSSGSSANALQTACAISGTNGSLSCPDHATGERFGASSVASGQNSLAAGSGASAAGDSSVALGRSASANSVNTVAIGHSAAAEQNSIAIGSSADATNGANSNDVVIGFSAQATDDAAVVIGYDASAAGNAVALGATALADFGGSIAIGRGATTTAANQLVVGSSGDGNAARISAAYFGNGVTAASPQDFVFNTSGGSGTDIQGADLTIASGRGTGSAAGADIIFQTSDAGASGATLRNLSTKMIIQGDGDVGISTSTPNDRLVVVPASNGDTTAIVLRNNVDNSNRIELGITSNDGTFGIYDSSNNKDIQFEADGLSYFNGGNVGIGTTSPDGQLELAGNTSAAAWGLNGIQLQASAATYTDSSTAASGTVTDAVFNSFAQPTLAATNSSVTTTRAATVYIAGAPATGTNQTITNAYALWIDAGMTRLDGKLSVNGAAGANDWGGLFSRGRTDDAQNILNLRSTDSGVGNVTIADLNFEFTDTAGDVSRGARIIAGEEVDWTGLGSTHDAYLALYTTLDGTTNEKLRVTGSGNVGIGDTTPAYLLTVGSGDLFGVDSSANLVFEGSADAFETTITVANAAADRTYTIPDSTGNATDTFCLLTLGNCSGSATTLQASYDADVDGSDTRIDLTDEDDSLVYSNPAASGTDSTYVLEVEQLATSGTKGALFVDNRGDSYSFRVDDASGDTTPFVVEADGDVGIGTATPGAQLQVTGGSNGHLTFNATAVTSGYTGSFTLNDTGLVLATNSASRNIILQANGTTTSRLTQTNSQLAIGDASAIDANALVQIRKARGDFGLLVTDGTDNSKAVGLYVDTEGDGALYLYDNAGTLRTHISSDGGDSYISQGNVGIGTTSLGTNKLTVADNATSGPTLAIQNTRSSLLSTHTVGTFDFSGADTQLTTQNVFARIQAVPSTDVITDAAAGRLLFYTTGTGAGGSPVLRLKLDETGRFSIGNGGENTAVTNLTLSGDSATELTTTFRREDGTVAADETIGILDFYGTDSQLTTQNIYGRIQAAADGATTTDAAAGYLAFYTTGTTLAGTPQERLRISAAGNVGIGDTSPVALLTVGTSDALQVDATGDTRTAGYLRVGSNSAPTNTTAGDLTSIRLSVGNSGTFGTTTGRALRVTNTTTNAAAGADSLAMLVNTIQPASNSSAENRALYAQNVVDAATGVTHNIITGGRFENRIRGDGAVANSYAVQGNAVVVDSSSAANVNVTNAIAFNAIGFERVTGTSTATIGTLTGFNTSNLGGTGLTATSVRHLNIGDITATSVTNQIGLNIAALTTGTNNAGIVIGEAASGNNANLILGQTTIPSGSYSIYNSSTDDNYFAGDLGIGTTSPGAKLDVISSVSAADSSSIGARVQQTDSGNVTSTPQTKRGLWVDSTYSGTYTDPDGNLLSFRGIDITPNVTGTPSGVWNSLEIIGARVQPTYNGGALTGGDDLSMYGTYTSLGSSIGTTGATTKRGSYISVQGTADTNIGLEVSVSDATNNYAALFQGGSVGIGDSTPSSETSSNFKLDVAGDIKATGDVALYPDTALNFNNYWNGSNSIYLSTQEAFSIYHDNTGNALEINYAASGTAGTAATFATGISLSSAGAVTIGNTAGNTPVTINTGTGALNIGDNAGTRTTDIGGVDTNGADTINIATNATSADTITIGSTHASSIATLNGGAYNLNIRNTGVGINATAPTTGSVDLFFGNGADRMVNINQASSGVGNTLTIQAGRGAAGANAGGTLLLQGGAQGTSGGTGSVIVRANGSNSTTAFQIQQSDNTVLFAADTTNKLIKVGTGTPSIISAATGGLYVTNHAEIVGRLLVGTTTNGADTNSGQLRYAGTFRNDRFVALKPEFEGAILRGDGSSNTGTMISELCSDALNINDGGGTNACDTSQAHTYYEWTTAEATSQDYDLYVRWRIPSDMDTTSGTGFDDNITINMYGWRTNSSDSILVNMYNDEGSVCGTADQAVTANDTDWTTLGFAGIAGDADCESTNDASDILAGEYVVFRFRMTADNSEIVRLGEIEISYKSVF